MVINVLFNLLQSFPSI